MLTGLSSLANRYSSGVQGLDSTALSRCCIDSDHIQFHAALDHGKTVNETRSRPEKLVNLCATK